MHNLKQKIHLLRARARVCVCVCVCVCVLVAQFCSNLQPHGLRPTRLLCPWDSQAEYWSGLPFPSPGDLPNPGIEPGSPTLKADSLPMEPP